MIVALAWKCEHTISINSKCTHLQSAAVSALHGSRLAGTVAAKRGIPVYSLLVLRSMRLEEVNPLIYFRVSVLKTLSLLQL